MGPRRGVAAGAGQISGSVLWAARNSHDATFQGAPDSSSKRHNYINLFAECSILLRQTATWRAALSGPIMRPVMPPNSRIQQIIDHERAIYRSLTPFGLSLLLITCSLVVLAIRN